MTDMRAALLIDDGFQDAEVIYPYYRLLEEGLHVDLLGRRSGADVQGKYGYTFRADAAVGKAKAKDYDLVVVPGGYAPSHMRTYRPFVSFVKAMDRAGKVVAAICHGPQLLIEAGIVQGRRMTGFKGVATDLRNAGAKWVEEAAVTDGHVVTSRTPEDLPAFLQAVCAALETEAAFS